jgi:hypothetical protein
MIYSSQLFLGILIDSSLDEALRKINPSLKVLFIQNQDPYLSEIELNNQKFLGKFAGKITDLQSLELLKDNIFSFLKKILPSVSFTEAKMLLLALPENE